MHTTLKQKEGEEKKSHYDIFLIATTHPPPKQHMKFKFSKSDASKIERVQKCRSCSIFTMEKARPLKRMALSRPLSGATN
jgi:hypothetical protein